jgi:hypothetical protein
LIEAQCHFFHRLTRDVAMKILIANPNTSTGVTDRLVASGRLVASAGTELIPMTAPRGGDRQRGDARDAGREARHVRCRGLRRLR